MRVRVRRDERRNRKAGDVPEAGLVQVRKVDEDAEPVARAHELSPASVSPARYRAMTGSGKARPPQSRSVATRRPDGAEAALVPRLEIREVGRERFRPFHVHDRRYRPSRKSLDREGRSTGSSQSAAKSSSAIRAASSCGIGSGSGTSYGVSSGSGTVGDGTYSAKNPPEKPASGPRRDPGAEPAPRATDEARDRCDRQGSPPHPTGGCVSLPPRDRQPLRILFARTTRTRRTGREILTGDGRFVVVGRATTGDEAVTSSRSTSRTSC